MIKVRTRLAKKERKILGTKKQKEKIRRKHYGNSKKKLKQIQTNCKQNVRDALRKTETQTWRV